MIVAQFYPNGEFTAGVSTPKRSPAPKTERQYKSVTPYTQQCKEAYLRWRSQPGNVDVDLRRHGQQFINKHGELYTYLCEDASGHHFALEGVDKVHPDVLMNEPIGRLVARGQLIPLVYQSVEFSPQAPKAPSRKHCEKMTTRMARNIRNAVYLLEEREGKDNLSFLTLTLPDLSQEELAKCCANWGAMTDQMLKSLRKKIEKYADSFDYVYCTEIQPYRYSERGEYAPHLHIIFRGRSHRRCPWYVSPKKIRAAWTAIIAGIIGRRDFCTSALENLQRIRKSAARYLSKYMGKGKNAVPIISGESSPVQPLHCQWGGMARRVARMVRSGITRVASDKASREFLLSFLKRMDELLSLGIIKYCTKSFISIGFCQSAGVERFLPVYSGCLAAPTYSGGLLALQEALGVYA
jgi:hypothetical protein